MPAYNRQELETLHAEVKAGKHYPVYLFWGDEFLIKQAITRLLDILIEENRKELALKILDGDSEKLSNTIETLDTFSMFGSAKIVWVKNSHIFDSKRNAKDLLRLARTAYNDGERPEAARRLVRVMNSIGWTAEEVLAGRLNTLNEKEWLDTFGSERISNDINWMADLAEYIKAQDVSVTQDEEGGLLERSMERGFAGRNVLVLSCLTVDKRQNLFKQIKKTGVVIDLTLREGGGKQARTDRQDVISKQIRQILRAEGKEIGPQALSLLIGRAGENLRTIEQELAKLISFIGERSRIEWTDVEEIVSLDREEAVYEIMDAIGDRDAGRSMSLLRRLQEQSIHLLAIHSIMVRKVRQLLWAKGFLHVKNGGQPISGRSYTVFQKGLFNDVEKTDRSIIGNLAPFAVFKLLQQAEKFKMQELFDAMEFLLDNDVKLKSGALEPERLVESMILRLGTNVDKRPQAFLFPKS